MPRTREQFAEMKDERKSSILKAALPLFSLNGNKVSIDAICEKAKCSHGIVYHYFKNTDEILATLIKNPVFLEINNKIFDKLEGSSYEKLEQIISVLLDVSEKKFENVCYLNMLIKSKEKNSVYSLLVALVKEAQKSTSVVGGDPSQLVDTLYYLLKGLYLSFLLEKHPVVKVPSVEIVMQLIRKPNNFYHHIP